MRQKVEGSRNQTDPRYIRHHPKRDRFPMRRIGLEAALVLAVAILLIVLRSPWAI